jgi:hypothetical protein
VEAVSRYVSMDRGAPELATKMSALSKPSPTVPMEPVIPAYSNAPVDASDVHIDLRVFP